MQMQPFAGIRLTSSLDSVNSEGNEPFSQSLKTAAREDRDVTCDANLIRTTGHRRPYSNSRRSSLESSLTIQRGKNGAS